MFKNMGFLVYFIIICLSLHACNGRFLGVTGKEQSRQKLQPFDEGLEKTELDKVLSAIPQLQAQAKNPKKENEIMVPSPQVVLQVAADEQVFKRQTRSILQNDAEEIKTSKENDVVEDIVVMDYAQPHRKPPIHNKEP